MTDMAAKIAKLIAKADSTTSPDEADTFMSKAHQLMMDHGLSLLDLGRLCDDPVGIDEDAITLSTAGSWAVRVAANAARYYGCRPLLGETNRKPTLTLAGRESARVTAVLMVPYLIRAARAQALLAYAAGGYKTRGQARSAVGNALALRLQALNRAQVAERESSAPNSTTLNALVPVDLIDQMLKEKYPNIGTRRAGRVTHDGNAQAYAGKIGLSMQTGAAPLARRLT